MLYQWNVVRNLTKEIKARESASRKSRNRSSPVGYTSLHGEKADTKSMSNQNRHIQIE